MSDNDSDFDHPPGLPPVTWEDVSAQPDPDVLAPAPWAWWEAFAVFGLTFFTSALLAVVVAAAFRNDLEKAMGVIAFEVTLGFWAIMWVRLRHRLPVRALGVRFDRLQGDLGFGLAAGAVGWGLATLVVGNLFLRLVDALSKTKVTEPDQLDYTNPSALVLGITAIGVIIIAPISEELFFRGFVFRGFRRGAGLAIAAAGSGVLFTLAHLPFWLIFPSIFTLGVVLAWTFERRSSLIPCIVAHMLFNLAGFIFYLQSL